MFKEMLINCLCGMKRKAHGAQKPRHILKYVEVTKDIPNGYNVPIGNITPRYKAIWRFARTGN
jgi:hypothetical protein